MTKRKKRKDEDRKKKRGDRHAASEGRARVAREGCDLRFAFRLRSVRFQFRSLAGSVRLDLASFNSSISRPSFISLLQWNTLYTAVRLRVDRSRRNCEVGRKEYG